MPKARATVNPVPSVSHYAKGAVSRYAGNGRAAAGLVAQ